MPTYPRTSSSRSSLPTSDSKKYPSTAAGSSPRPRPRPPVIHIGGGQTYSSQASSKYGRKDEKAVRLREPFPGATGPRSNVSTPSRETSPHLSPQSKHNPVDHTIPRCEAWITIHHEIHSYFQRELAHLPPTSRPSIRHILTLTGLPDRCYADKAEQCMKWQWPKTFEIVLEACDKVFELEESGACSTFQVEVSRAEKEALAVIDTSVKSIIRVSLRVPSILMQEENGIVQDIAHQIAWLIAAIRPPIPGKVFFSQSLVERDPEGSYVIRLVPLEAIEDDSQMCWLPLMQGAVLVRDSPIPCRDNQVGLEIPFHLMTELAGPMYPVKQDGGIYLQGFSRLLYPTYHSDDLSWIQWHLGSSCSSRQKLQLGLLSNNQWVQIASPSQLSSARTFLGVYREAIVNLGTTSSIDYFRGIRFSGAFDETHSAAIGAPTSVSIGTSGMGIFGASVSAPIIYGKSLMRAGDGIDHDYLDILQICKERPIILYDTGQDSERGWMVSMLCVILHLIHTWAARTHTSNDVPVIDPRWDGGEAAYDALKDLGNLDLRDHSSSEQARASSPRETGQRSSSKTLGSLVKRFWQGITKRAAVDLEKVSEDQLQINVGWSKLYGWEYMDLILDKPSHRQQIPFQGNWKPFTEDVPILFAQGLGEVISRHSCVQACPHWSTVPAGKQYLVAMVDCLRWLAWTRGGDCEELCTMRLTNEHYWLWHETKVFSTQYACSLVREEPACANSNHCAEMVQSLESSDRLNQQSRQIVMNKAFHSGFDQFRPPREAAVVFGHRQNSPRTATPSPGQLQHNTLLARLVRSARINSLSVLNRRFKTIEVRSAESASSSACSN